MGLPLPTCATVLVVIFIIPFSAFAVLTTTLATVLLLSRVILVYIRIGIALVQAYFSDSPSPATFLSPDLSPEAIFANDGAESYETAPSHLTESWHSGMRKRSSLDLLNLELPPPVVPDARDYEGIGGWRLDEGQDEAQGDVWLHSNSRLELPSETELPRRRHFRSSTSSGIVPRGGSFSGPAT